MSQLRKFREECCSKKLEMAASDCGEYRKVKKAAKTSWQHDFAAALDQEPVPHLRDRFQKKFADGLPGLNADLRDLRQSLLRRRPETVCEEFDEEEVKRAVMKGKGKKAIGPDEVPQKLLKALVEVEEGLSGLTTFFNSILPSQCMPQQWQTSILTLLAKVEVPCHASQLRPVALTNRVYKTFSRLVLQRISRRGGTMRPIG